MNPHSQLNLEKEKEKKILSRVSLSFGPLAFDRRLSDSDELMYWG